MIRRMGAMRKSRIAKKIAQPPIWVTGLLIVLLGLLGILNAMTALSRIEPGLREQIEDYDTRFDIIVDMDFRIERYHINYFQSVGGRVSRVEDSRVLMRSVPVESIRSISRKYWVHKIRENTGKE